MTKNYQRLAVKQLIKSAAQSHITKPSTVLKLFRYARDADQGSCLVGFRILMLMCFNHPLVVQQLVAGEVIDISAYETDVDQPTIDRYKFLYHMIDNFYERCVEEFHDLTFYPRLEDLFPRPKPVSISEPVTEPITETVVTESQIIVPDSQIVVVKARAWTWNKQQQSALKMIYKWLRSKDRKQIFRLFGWAGTGKTEMSKEVADFVMMEMGKRNVPIGSVLFAAYSGKACSVLRVKGCRGADTLHSLLYKPLIDPVSGQVIDYILNSASPLSQCALLIVDEVSMVNADMAADIMSFGCPILVLGDPEQLPPIEGEGYFINDEPDFMLTDVERQAKENPIIELATRVRTDQIIKPGRYGSSVVYDSGYHVSDEMYASHDQILCGLNATRKTINKRSRRINGKADKSPIYPTGGDRLICTRNNKIKGLYNGTLWTSASPKMRKILRPAFKGSTEMKEGSLDVLSFKIRSIDELDAQGNPYVVSTQCSPHYFNDGLKEPPFRDLIGSDQFDYGYGMTVHKSQGSQFGSVMIYDESSAFREHARKHRYTAFTRAADRITVLL